MENQETITSPEEFNIKTTWGTVFKVIVGVTLASLFINTFAENHSLKEKNFVLKTELEDAESKAQEWKDTWCVEHPAKTTCVKGYKFGY